MKNIRCAIYTRKSSEEELEQEFNSLHAQREACAADAASQKHEGWVLLPVHYDAIKRGATFEQIAASEKLSKRRILQVIDLAFLAPDIVRSVVQGDQPIALVAKWLGQDPLPSDWEAQQRIVATR